MRARRRPPPLHMTSRLPEKIASLNPPFRPTVNDLEPLIIALALEETCNEVSAAMAREGFVPRERHRLSPEDTPVSGAARKRGATFVLDFEPAGLSDDAGLHPLEMALCMCPGMTVLFQVDIEGMMCAGCSGKVEKKLKENAQQLGITNVKQVSSDHKCALLEARDVNSINLKGVEQLIVEAGYNYKGSKLVH
jgi:copper chaperone CopZ